MYIVLKTFKKTDKVKPSWMKLKLKLISLKYSKTKLIFIIIENI